MEIHTSYCHTKNWVPSPLLAMLRGWNAAAPLVSRVLRAPRLSVAACACSPARFFSVSPRKKERRATVRVALDAAAAAVSDGGFVHSGGKTLAPISVALVGRPNVGKSSLFNRLTRSRLALVNAEPGTTRDWREAPAQLGALHFTVLDTGGLV